MNRIISVYCIKSAKGEVYMTGTKKMTCIVCPVGCQLQAGFKTDGIVISGNSCRRGYEYALSECTNPVRSITTTVRVKNGLFHMLPVKSAGWVPKAKVSGCIKLLKDLELNTPVHNGDIIVKNILGTGTDIVAARDMENVTR